MINILRRCKAHGMRGCGFFTFKVVDTPDSFLVQSSLLIRRLLSLHLRYWSSILGTRRARPESEEDPSDRSSFSACLLGNRGEGRYGRERRSCEWQDEGVPGQ